MTNLLFEDRQTTLNLKLFALTFITFLALLVSIGTSKYLLLIPMSLTLYILFAFLNRWFIKKAITPKAIQVNAFKRIILLSFEKYGILKAEHGKLLFINLNHKTEIILDTAHFKGDRSKLHIHIISPATNLHLKTIEIRKGIYRYRVPIEVWNLLYEKLPPFDVNNQDYKLYKLPKKILILFNLFFSFSPLLTKIFFNLIFRAPLLSGIYYYDLILTGFLLIISFITLFKNIIIDKNKSDLSEIEVLDPYRLIANEVRGLEDVLNK